jgi:hypothetical protein
MVLIGGAEEQTAIQWDRSMWLRKGGDGILRRGDEGGCGDHVGWDRSGGCSSTTRNVLLLKQI